MDPRPWESSANRYYAFGGEKVELPRRISQTPPPPSTRHSRSPLSTTHPQKPAPASPMSGSSPLPKSSLLDRISPKGYSPQSKPAKELPPLSPELADYLDSRSDEEVEEEQVIRVLDNNHELVYQRDFGPDERQDRDGDLPEPRSSSPAKKRKLTHPGQPAGTPTPQSSPTQNKTNSKAKRTHSNSRSPPLLQSNATSPSKKQPLASRIGVDWSSGSSGKGGSQFGNMSSLTFGFAGYGHDPDSEAGTSGEATLQDHVGTTPGPEHSQDDRRDDARNPRQLEAQIDTREPGPSSTRVITPDRSGHTRQRGEGRNSNGGTSLLRRIGSHRPISDPELAVPPGGGEDHDSGHEAKHEGRETAKCDASSTLSLAPHSPSEGVRMDSPPPFHESPQTPNREDLPEDVARLRPATSPRTPPRPPRSRSPSQQEITDEGTKSMEQDAEDFLQDIQKEFLSKSEAQAKRSSTGLGGIIPRFSGGASTSSNGHDEHRRISPTPFLDGMSPLVRRRSISPILDTDQQYIASDAMSVFTHTPRSTHEGLPTSFAQFANDPDLSNTLVDPELDQMTKEAIGDLIVNNLKVRHDIDANDAVRRAVKFEVDEHAREFLILATKLARRMDLIGEPLEDAGVPDVEPTQLLTEPMVTDPAGSVYLEYLPPIEGSEANDGPQPDQEETKPVTPDVEMDSVPPGVSRLDSEGEDEAGSNDEPADEQKLDIEPIDENDEPVDHADEDDPQESGLEIPGVWCARTGRDRTDTLQEHVEISQVLAARVKKWVKKSGASEHEPGRGPVAMHLMCLQTSVMQDLYASFEDDARPVEDFFTALKALKCTWPTGGKLMVQIKSGEPERTRTWFSHQLVQGKPLDISSVIHPGRVTLQFVQLADLSNYVFLLLVSEPGVAGPTSPRKTGGAAGGSGAGSKTKVDEYLSRLEFSSSSASS